MKKTFIYITTQFEGFHKYPNAPEEVSYLRHLHRHIFHVKAEIEVFHDDRELEFIMLKHEVEGQIRIIMAIAKDSISCEMIANRIYEHLKSKYSQPMLGKARKVRITVNEDNENGVVGGDF